MAQINYLTLRPEQALKIYDDYVQQDKPNDALTLLFYYLSSFGSRLRKQYADQPDVSVASNIQNLHKLMLCYIELRLKMGINMPEELTQLKEVLKAFRQMTQHTHFQSFHHVLNIYRSSVEKMLEEKIKEYSLEELQKLPFVGQLSYEEPAEELLYLCFDPEAKTQKDQMKGCLRMLWETYRTIMENVKWNEKMEELYFDALKRVSAFCLRFKRRGEFAWFCEHINKFVLDLNVRDIDLKKNPSHVDLSKPATNDKHVSARFEVVKTAMAIEMWAEAFKTLETILVLKQMRKGIFKTSNLMQYYELLAQIFSKSGNALYQAFAYYNHYIAFKKKPCQNQEEIMQKQQQMHEKLNHLVLSVLVIPLNENMQREKVSLFEQGTIIPTREELMNILYQINAVQLVSPEIRQVYNILQIKQNLLTVSEFNFDLLQQNYSQYIPALKENLTKLVLVRVSEMYKTIKFSALLNILKFADQDKIFSLLQNCKIDFKEQIIEFLPQAQDASLSLLPTFMYQMQLDKKTIDPFEQAKGFLESSKLEMLTREQTIKKLIKQSDPNEIDKEWKEAKLIEKQENEQRKKEEEAQQRFKQERINEMEQRKAKEISLRSKILADIIKLKGSKYVTFEINGERKNIQNLSDADLLIIDTPILSDIKKKFEEEAKKGADDKFMRAYKRCEYIERERQNMESALVKEWVETDLEELQQKHKEYFMKALENKTSLQSTIEFTKEEQEKIKKIKEADYVEQLIKWKENLNKTYVDEVIQRAKRLHEDAEKKKEEDKLRREREERERQRMAQQPQGQSLRNYKNEQPTANFQISRSTNFQQQQQQQPPAQAQTTFTNTAKGAVTLARNTQQQQQQETKQQDQPLFTNTKSTTSTANTGGFTLSRSTQQQQQQQQQQEQEQQQQQQQPQQQQDDKYKDPNNRFSSLKSANKQQQSKPQVTLSRNTQK